MYELSVFPRVRIKFHCNEKKIKKKKKIWRTLNNITIYPPAMPARIENYDTWLLVLRQRNEQKELRIPIKRSLSTARELWELSFQARFISNKQKFHGLTVVYARTRHSVHTYSRILIKPIRRSEGSRMSDVSISPPIYFIRFGKK